MREHTKQDYMDEVIMLRGLVRLLRDGMRASEQCGCTDHLDCWDDAERLWYGPIEVADNVLGTEE